MVKVVHLAFHLLFHVPFTPKLHLYKEYYFEPGKIFYLLIRFLETYAHKYRRRRITGHSCVQISAFQCNIIICFFVALLMYEYAGLAIFFKKYSTLQYLLN